MLDKENHVIQLSLFESIELPIEHLIDECSCVGKKCSRCKITKCHKAFSVFRKHKTGLQFKCKKCNAEQSEVYRNTHREQRRASSRVYQKKKRLENPEEARRKDREFYAKNIKKQRKRLLRYYSTHREALCTYSRKYHNNHKAYYVKKSTQHRKDKPDSYRAYRRNRRARKKGATGSFTAVQWKELKDLYNYTCLCCGRQEPDIKLTADHVVPLVKGGSNYISNIQPLCKPCNSSKNVKSTDYRIGYMKGKNIG